MATKHNFKTSANKPFTKVFVVYETLNEFGVRGKIVGVSSDKDKAELLAAGKGWYGGEGAIERGVAVTVDGQDYLLMHPLPVKIDGLDGPSRNKLRTEGLKKLTDMEKKALGLE